MMLLSGERGRFVACWISIFSTSRRRSEMVYTIGLSSRGPFLSILTSMSPLRCRFKTNSLLAGHKSLFLNLLGAAPCQ